MVDRNWFMPQLAGLIACFISMIYVFWNVPESPKFLMEQKRFVEAE
jgi:hypothetical protein